MGGDLNHFTVRTMTASQQLGSACSKGPTKSQFSQYLKGVEGRGRRAEGAGKGPVIFFFFLDKFSNC